MIVQNQKNCFKYMDSLPDPFLRRDYFRTYMRGSDEIHEGEDSRRLIFVGTMPDTLTIHYVKHKKESGIMKLRKVNLYYQLCIMIFNTFSTFRFKFTTLIVT